MVHHCDLPCANLYLGIINQLPPHLSMLQKSHERCYTGAGANQNQWKLGISRQRELFSRFGENGDGYSSVVGSKVTAAIDPGGKNGFKP